MAQSHKLTSCPWPCPGLILYWRHLRCYHGGKLGEGYTEPLCILLATSCGPIITEKQKAKKTKGDGHDLVRCILKVTYPGGLVCACAQPLSHVGLSETSWTVVHQAPLSVGFSRQEYWSVLPFPSPGVLINPGIESVSPGWQAGFLPLSQLGSLGALLQGLSCLFY